jgi:uncharacterized membrane protein YphA (DoxX/SURF4 family)
MTAAGSGLGASSSSVEAAKLRKRAALKAIGLWSLSVLLALLFLMSGASKLAGAEVHVRNFARWGYPEWFRNLVGVVEATSAVLLLVPRAAFFGATGLAAVMVGATYTHLFRVTGEGRMAGFTLLLLLLAGIVAWARRASLGVRSAGPTPKVV